MFALESGLATSAGGSVTASMSYREASTILHLKHLEPCLNIPSHATGTWLVHSLSLEGKPDCFAVTVQETNTVNVIGACGRFTNVPSPVFFNAIEEATDRHVMAVYHLHSADRASQEVTVQGPWDRLLDLRV